MVTIGCRPWHQIELYLGPNSVKYEPVSSNVTLPLRIPFVFQKYKKLKCDIEPLHLLQWPESATLTTGNARENVQQQGLSLIAVWNAKQCHHLGIVWWFLVKLNILLPYDPAICGPWHLPNVLKIYVRIKTCKLSTAAFFKVFIINV